MTRYSPTALRRCVFACRVGLGRGLSLAHSRILTPAPVPVSCNTTNRSEVPYAISREPADPVALLRGAPKMGSIVCGPEYCGLFPTAGSLGSFVPVLVLRRLSLRIRGEQRTSRHKIAERRVTPLSCHLLRREIPRICVASLCWRYPAIAMGGREWTEEGELAGCGGRLSTQDGLHNQTFVPERCPYGFAGDEPGMNSSPTLSVAVMEGSRGKPISFTFGTACTGRARWPQMGVLDANTDQMGPYQIIAG